MQIEVISPQLQTLTISAILILGLALSARKVKDLSFLSPSLSNELKGLAILMVVFSHIGYFLATDHAFLFPLSVFAGVGVNLFLFLSGYGLLTSTINQKPTIIGFYKKRLLKIFLPLWIVLPLLLLLDWQILGKTHPLNTVISSFFGWFPTAQIFTDLNSPLWYFSLILFYYLIFPFVSWKWLIYFSPLLVFLTSYLIVSLPLPVEESLVKLYKLHLWAFPLGMILALVSKVQIYKRLKTVCFFKWSWVVQYLLLIFLIWVVGYTALHSGVGEGLRKEQLLSLITTGAWVGIFLLKPFKFNLLALFGIYSYEVYLIHWPILYRYGFIYQILPPFLATLVYLVLFLAMGFVIQRLASYISQKISK